jgi:dienelactone hydrolase
MQTSLRSLLIAALIMASRSALAGDQDLAWPGNAAGPQEFQKWQVNTRAQLRQMLGIPAATVPLAGEKRGESEHDGVVIERWVFTCEPGSRAPAVLYRPKSPPGPMPAIVFTFGHGCSKIHWSYDYAAKLYAKMGLAVLAIDPMGEAERNASGREGTREHDQKLVDERAAAAGRMIIGKLVFDTLRGVDFLLERKDIDHEHIGVAGYSLGGAKASWVAALDPRIKLALVCGWAYDDVILDSKLCTKVPFTRMRKALSWNDFAALAAPECAICVMNGDADWIIDQKSDGSAWKGTRKMIAETAPIYEKLGARGRIEAWFEPEAGHRAFFAYREALLAIHKHLGTPAATEEQIRKLPTLNAGRWCDTYEIKLEKLYGTQLHDRGATLVDMKLTPTPSEYLRCLKPDELGSPEFTIEGWLNAAGSKRADIK